MNFSEIGIIIILIIIIVLDVKYLYKNRNKNCGQNCSSCYIPCHLAEDIKRAKKEILEENRNKESNNKKITKEE